MGRLFVLFFVLPWWAYVPASIGVLWLGERVYEQALEIEAEKVAALETAVPDPVDIAEFDRDRDIHAADEVHVSGRINTDLNYNLTEGINGIPIRTRHMYMMFGASDPSEAPEVRAALVLSAAERDVFVERIEEFIAEFTDSGVFIFAFNGFADTTSSMDRMAAEVIKEQGLTKAEDFIYIEPFFEGREAALSRRGIPPDQSRYIGWAIAAVVALIGVVKRVRSVRARASESAQEALEPVEVEPYTPVPAQTFTVPEGVSEDTPLGRLARRNASGAAPAHDEEPGYANFNEPDPETVYGTHDLDMDPPDAQPARALAHASGATLTGDAESPFPPVGDVGDIPAPARQSSLLAYYVKLGLAMLVVGGIAYDPSLIATTLPVGGVALFWLGVYAVFRKFRSGRAQTFGADDTAPQHTRRPDGAAQPVAVGVPGTAST